MLGGRLDIFNTKKVSKSLLCNFKGALKRNYSTDSFDAVVIGAGPAGYIASIKGSQLGLKVACVEGNNWGGTCLNVGCIPSKALLHSSHLYHVAKNELEENGIIIQGPPKFDFSVIMKNKESVVNGLIQGIDGLFARNKVVPFKGWAKIRSQNVIDVLNNDGNVINSLNAKNIVIASGSEVSQLPGLDIDGEHVISSKEALSLKSVPKSMIVVGGGVIGLELGSVYSRLGCDVTVVEFSDSICSGADAEVSKTLKKILEKQGIKFILKSAVKSANPIKNENITVDVVVEDVDSKKQSNFSCEKVLVCVGRRAFTKNLGLENVGIKVDKRGIIETDDHYRTNVPGIYAIGDVVKGPMLAHKAEEEGVAIMESIVTPGCGHVNYGAIPSVVYTSPEVAWVGSTEEMLKKDNIKYRVGKYPIKANSRGRTNHESEGFVKVLSDYETDRILGVHMICSVAGEMIAESVLAMEYGASSEDIARTCHAHPTLSEAVKEAANMAYNIK